MLEMTEALIKEGWSMAPEGSETEVMFSEALEEIKHARASAQDSDYDALIEELERCHNERKRLAKESEEAIELIKESLDIARNGGPAYRGAMHRARCNAFLSSLSKEQEQ
jgi:hypothetical protein